MADDAPDVSTFTPQEKFLYEHHLQNLAMPEAQNEDGTHSSLLATTMSFGDKTYILPSIYNGKRFDKPEDIEREARNVGLENFPSYASPEEADARYEQLHARMEQDQPGQAGAAADVREALEQKAIARRKKLGGTFYGGPEPGFNPEGPNAPEAIKELKEIRDIGSIPTTQGLPNYFLKYGEARAQGYSREEFQDYTNKLTDDARKQGYSTDEINLYLMGVAPRHYTGAEKPNPTVGAVGEFFYDWNNAWFGPHNSNYAPSMGLPTPGAMTGGAMWKQLGWSMWDVAKTFPGALVGGMGAMAELGDGSEKTDGETAKLIWEAAQVPLFFAPYFLKFGKKLPRFDGGPALEGEIIPPGPRGGPPGPPGPRGGSRTGPIIEGEFRPAQDVAPYVHEGEVLPPETRGGPGTPRLRQDIEGEYRGVGQEVTPASAFPKFEDFLDGATGLAQKHPDGFNPANLPVILRQLGDHFISTGDHPMATAQAHSTYDSFLAHFEQARLAGPLSQGLDSVMRTPTQPNLPVPMSVVRAGDFADGFTKRLMAGEFEGLTQDGITARVAETFKQLMADESGAIKWPFWRQDISPDEMFRPDPVRYGEVVNNVRAIFSPASMSPRLAGKAKALMAWSALETERVIYGLNQYSRYVAELSDDMRINMIAAYQRGLLPVIENPATRHQFNFQYPQGDPMRLMADNYLKPGSPLFGLFKEMQFHSDQAWKKMDQLGIAPGYVFNYFPGEWKEMEAARAFIGKGKLGNTGKFRMEKSIPDILAGIQAGLTPVSTNPIQVMAARLASQQKWIRDWQVFRQFEADGAILPADRVTPDMMRDGWTRAPEYFSLPGENVAQKYVHPDAARLLHGMTNSGFAKYSLYRILRSSANFVTSVNLAGPGFHSTFVTFDAMSTDLALGMQELSRALFNPSKGMWGEALQAAKSMMRSPLAPLLNARAGMAMKALAERPGINQPTILGLPTDVVSRALTNYMEGGGRMGLEDIYKSSRGGSFWKGLKAQFSPSDGHMTFTQEIAEMARDTYGDVRIGGVLKVPAWTALFTARMVARLGDTLSAPLMGFYVPMLKAGTFYRHIESAMRVAPNMGPMEIQRVAGNISSMLDNRFGEMVYDNKFWNAYAKTTGQLVFRAMGFNYGALDTLVVGTKEIASALVGKPDRLKIPKLNPATGLMEEDEIKQFGSKASALIGMAMFTALSGAFIGVLEGTWNEDWKPYDYLYPKLANGQRIKLPSHMNNAYEFYNHPGDSFRNRVNGLWVNSYDQLRNMQWDGKTPIVPPKHEEGENPLKSWNNPEALADRFDYWQHGMWPYMLQQWANPTAAQMEIDPALRMLGVGPAPWEIREPEKAKRFDAKQAKERQKAWDYQQKRKRELEQKRGR